MQAMSTQMITSCVLSRGCAPEVRLSVSTGNARSVKCVAFWIKFLRFKKEKKEKKERRKEIEEKKAIRNDRINSTRSITSHSLSHFYLGIYACVCVCAFFLHLVAAASCERCGELYLRRVFNYLSFVSLASTRNIRLKSRHSLTRSVNRRHF